MRGGLRGSARSCVGISKQVVRMLPRSKQSLLFEMDFCEECFRRTPGYWNCLVDFWGSTLLSGHFLAFFRIYSA